jgi:hypothetical protein
VTTFAITEPEAPARARLIEARQRWERASQAERELRRHHTWQGRSVSDGPAWTLAVAELEEEKREAALELRDAAARVHALDVEHAGLLLDSAVVKYDQAAELVEERRLRFETQWCRLIVAGWALLEAAAVERQLAGVLARTAKAAAPSDEVRERITQGAAVEVPVAVGLDGPTECRERPNLAVFGGHGDVSDPRKETFWENIGRLVTGGRKRAGIHVGRAVLDRLEQTADPYENRGSR